MNSSSIFPFSAKPLAELKVHWVKSLQQWLLKFSICLLGVGVALQVHASNHTTPSADSSTAKAAESKLTCQRYHQSLPRHVPAYFCCPPLDRVITHFGT